MRDERKTKERLVRELRSVQAKLEKLETSEAKRRNAEDALEQSEKRYRRLVEGLCTSSKSNGQIFSFAKRYFEQWIVIDCRAFSSSASAV